MAWRTIPGLLFAWILPAGFCNPANGHDSLYDYLEVRPLEDGRTEIAISLHAADFAGKGTVDPDTNDTGWFTELNSVEKHALVSRANRFLQSALILSLPPDASGREALPLTTPLLPQNVKIDTGARPGSLIATHILPLSPSKLSVSYFGKKRLLVVISRPKSFPEVTDLPPESARTIPVIPSSETPRTP